ncbi:MAG TPA: SseB family protein [Candidatus Limnocylindria bacterium]|nr:SseB family protein [Candidatus Limnocylindria bacterium]
MVLQRPAPGSHDRSTPSGALEESSATLFEAMLAARDADDGSDANQAAVRGFYRALADGVLLLPVPPDHGEEALSELERAVSEDAEVRVSVMLAADPAGNPVSVCFGSVAALSAWAPRGTASLPLPARIALANMAAAGVPAILDPSGPIPYRFEPDELADLAAGRLPGSHEPLFAPVHPNSIRVRLAGPQALVLREPLATALRTTPVEAAWLVERESDGEWGLVLGLLGEEGGSEALELPGGVAVEWLEGRLADAVGAISPPFYRRGR